jgi:SAM-dependent methyltransferase
MQSWTPKAELYDFGRPFPAEQVVQLLDNTIVPAELSIAAFEPGCGTGRVLIPIAQARPNWLLTGTDSATATIAVIKERARNLELTNLESTVGDLTQTLPAKQFDLIIHSSVLHAVRQWKEALVTLRSLLSKGGYFCLIGDNGDLYDEALGRTPSRNIDPKLSTFWEIYRRAREEAGAPSTEASQVGCKWDLESSDIASELAQHGVVEVSRLSVEWTETFSYQELLKIVEEKCYSSIFTLSEPVFEVVLSMLRPQIADLGLNTIVKSRHRAVARYFKSS